MKVDSAVDIEKIAQVCHEANAAWCRATGDMTQKSWLEAEEWQRESARRGVKFTLDNPNAPASAQHEAWLADKLRDGWMFGPVKDAEKREHPCMVAYESLPLLQRIKGYLFRGVVNSFVAAISGE